MATLLANVSLDARLEATRRAVALAPSWPMGNVYLGDTLCLMGRVREAWPYYAIGFSRGPEQRDLVALGLQCLWEKGALTPQSSLWPELAALGHAHPGSWLDILSADLPANC